MTRRARIGAAVAGAAVIAIAIALAVCGRGTEDRSKPQQVSGAPSLAKPAAAATGSGAPRRGKLAPPLARTSLRGIVVDRAGAPVADAMVVLATPARSVRSDKDGRFTVFDLLPGRYVVEARRGPQIGGPISVDVDPRGAEVTLRLYEGFVLEVEVYAADTGKPIAGAEVEVSLLSMHAGAGRQRAVTAADGVARLDGLTFIGHQLRVAAPGFADDRRGPGPDLVERAPGVRRMRIGLERAVVEIAGMLVDEQGAPIEGGEVEAVVYQGGDRAVDDAKAARQYGTADPHAALRSGLGTRSDARGAFRIGLPHGTWVLIGSARARETAVSEPIFVEAGARREIKLVLGTGRTVRGVVVDGNDREVAAARVEARWLEGTRVLGSTVADNGGGFELRGLPAAPIELVARSGDGRSKPLRVDLVPSNVDGAVVVLELEGAITGRVVDDRGAAIADAVVTYLEERPGNAPSLYPDVTMTDHEGRFRIAGIATRVSYFLSAARPSDGSFAQHAAGVTARGGADVTITIPAGGAIVGRIVGADDPRALTVRDQQTASMTRPAADGRFRLDHLPANRYQLRISGAGIADTYVQDVGVGNGRDTDLGDVAVRAGRRVSGTVVDQRGRLVDDATVRIEVDGKYAVMTRAAAGKFALRVPALPLVVSASHLDVGRTAAVAVGATSNAPLRLAMLAGGVIQGIAKADGAAIADAPVTVWPVGPRPPEPVAATITDDAGHFTLRSVPTGRWLVELGIPALAHEHRVLQRGVEVGLGATVELELDASGAPAGTIVQPRSELPELPTYGEESD